MTDEKTKGEELNPNSVEGMLEAKKAANKAANLERDLKLKLEAEELARNGKRVTTDKNNNTSNKGTQTVEVSDFDMPFWSMVVFMVKWAIASIPAILILMVLFAIFGGFFFAIFN